MLMFFPDVHGIYINTSFPLSYQNVIKPLSKAKEETATIKFSDISSGSHFFFHVVGDEAASVIMRACASSQPKMEQAGLHAI
jgi:hypothetical protein